eukprot:6182456-Pleurochrysis_carterae.AAC.4
MDALTVRGPGVCMRRVRDVWHMAVEHLKRYAGSHQQSTYASALRPPKLYSRRRQPPATEGERVL